MKVILMPILLTVLSCTQNLKPEAPSVTRPDTVVGRKIITDEIAGSAYRNRAMGYFLIVKNDTSKFTCIISEMKEGYLMLDMCYLIDRTTYRQRLGELSKILPEVEKDFVLDSLKSIDMGSMTEQGDLAIKITHEYLQQGGNDGKLPANAAVSEFLKRSSLALDFNDILFQHNLKTSRMYVEKAHFTPRRALYWGSTVEADSTTVPDKILECLVYVGVEQAQ